MTSPTPAVLQEQINKRLMHNLLIQGAAAHAFITASHLVKPELEEIQPGLTEMHHRLAIMGQLDYCSGGNAFFGGRPNLLWGYSSRPQRPFRHSPFLSRHMNNLARAETRRMRAIAKEKGLSVAGIRGQMALMRLVNEVIDAEVLHRTRLTNLAKQVAHEIWAIPTERLDGQLTKEVAFGNLQQPRTTRGRLFRIAAVGYGGVERRYGQFYVVARAWVFPLLVHELVKGTMELICLRGLSELDDAVYRAVIDEADQIEYEPWFLQAGPEMWRRLLAIAPRGVDLSLVVMAITTLEPEPLDALLTDMVECPETASAELEKLTADLLN